MKTNFKYIFLFLFFVAISNAQQDSQYTQYMYNPTIINPAYAGSRDVLSIFGLYRTQWVGLNGAPKTAVFSMHTPLNYKNLGIGVSFVNDQIGPSTQNTISGDVSYTIQTSENYKLAFGIKLTGDLMNVDYTKLNPQSGTDIVIKDNVDNSFSPNIGAGIFLYSDKAYLGFSMPRILDVELYDDNQYDIAKVATHYNLMGGYVFDLNYDFKFKPSALIKAVKGAPLQVDLSANFMYQNKFTLGVAYRWDAAFSGLAGFQVNDSWFIGYAHDRETTNLKHYNSGSHEIFLRYEFAKANKKVYSPRFF